MQPPLKPSAQCAREASKVKQVLGQLAQAVHFTFVFNYILYMLGHILNMLSKHVQVCSETGGGGVEVHV